ncbi:hypothetical protein, partial [Candidatus Enterococcus willemsii]
MDKLEILESIAYDTRGNSLENCSEEELKKIISDYYFGNKSLVKIIKEYDLNTTSNKIRQDFPKLVSKTKCKHDQNKMYLSLPSKEHLKYFSLEKDGFKCEKCNHRDKIDCMCENCKRIYRKQVREIYSGYQKIDFSDCNLQDRVELGALLQYFHVNSIEDNFGSYDDFHDEDALAFIDEIDTIKRLANKRIIVVSSESKIEAFPMEEDFPRSYYITRVEWKLNIKFPENMEKDNILDFLKYPNASIVSEERESNYLWRLMAIGELIRLVKWQMEEFNFTFKIDTDNDKFKDLFNRLLENLTPAQIYALIWSSVRKADNLRTSNKWGNYRYRHVDFIIKIIDETNMKKFNSGIDLKPYDYPYQMIVTLSAKILFEQILLKVDWFTTKIPNLDGENTSMIINFYEELEAREESIFLNKSMPIDYYYLTDFGIVIFDGAVSKLFSDEKTLYKISKFIKREDEYPDEEFYFNLKLPYIILGVYSTVYLL